MSRDGHLVDGPLGRIELPGSTLASLVVQAAEQVDGARVRRPRRGPRGRARRRPRAGGAGAGREPRQPCSRSWRGPCRRAWPRRSATMTGLEGPRRRRVDRGAGRMRPRSGGGRRAARRSSSSTSRISPASRSPRCTRACRTASRTTSPRRCSRTRSSSTGASPSPPTAGPPTGWVRSSGTSCGSASTSWRRGRCPPRWPSTKRSCWRSATPPTRPGAS